jgi:glycine betaine/choline ABC-type transport system substrate-binding protein
LPVAAEATPPADEPTDEETTGEDGAVAEEPYTVQLAAKGWSENMTLGYMAALLIEANTVHSVDTSKINMGPTEMLHPALVEGQIDIYPEYTGTAWMVVLGNEEVINDRREIYEAIPRCLPGAVWYCYARADRLPEHFRDGDDR